MGFFLIVCGSMIDIKQVGMPLYKGVIMTGTKFLLGVIVGLVVGKICGPEGFLGIAPFVLIATITNSNGSLYISLSSQFGNATDTGAISILSLNDRTILHTDRSWCNRTCKYPDQIPDRSISSTAYRIYLGKS